MCCLLEQSPRGARASRHVGEFELDAFELAKPRTKLLAFIGVGECVIEGGLGNADGDCCYGKATQVATRRGWLTTQWRLRPVRILRHMHVCEFELSDLQRPQSQRELAPTNLPASTARQEKCDRLIVFASQHESQIRTRRVRDPGFVAVQDPFVSSAPCARLDFREVRSGISLGQGKTCAGLA